MDKVDLHGGEASPNGVFRRGVEVVLQELPLLVADGQHVTLWHVDLPPQHHQKITDEVDIPPVAGCRAQYGLRREGWFDCAGTESDYLRSCKYVPQKAKCMAKIGHIQPLSSASACIFYNLVSASGQVIH